MTETTLVEVPLAGDLPPLVVKRWPRRPRSVTEARHLLIRHAQGWQLTPVVADTAELVLAELATNAVRHARVPGRLIETRFERLPDGGADRGARRRRHQAAAPDGR